MLQLFTFVRADLMAHKPQPRDALNYSEAGADGFGEPSTMSTSEPRFPKSLYLMKPLFGAYELNAVALNAQASVPVPEGLDLDAWIVPIQDEPASPHNAATDEALEGKKSKKGKKKESGKTKRKGKARAREEDDEYGEFEQAAPSQPVETAEERAERERVSVHPVALSPPPRASCLSGPKLTLLYRHADVCSGGPSAWSVCATTLTT